MRKIITLACVILGLLGIGTAYAVGVGREGEDRPAQTLTLTHPCDLNKSGRADDGTERLCLTVWGHDAYDVTEKDGGMSSTPAGPVVVTELIAAAELEGSGAAEYVRDGLANEVDNYARRDR